MGHIIRPTTACNGQGDRDGRVRLPRVKSATKKEFGWAAATAISQWVFERPMRKGAAVDVTVTIPVSFAPPKP